MWMFCSSNRLMYRSVLRWSLCPNNCLTYRSLPFRWYALDALKSVKFICLGVLEVARARIGEKSEKKT